MSMSGSLNYPKLALPDGEEAIAFVAVDQVLRADPTLSTVIRTWSSWRGEQADVAEPCHAMCPMLRLSPGGLPGGWETEGQQRQPMSIGIQLVVAGTDVRQLMNLYGAVRRALWPRQPDRYEAIHTKMQTAGITRGTLSRPVYGARLDEKAGSRLLIAEGSLDLFIMISTP